MLVLLSSLALAATYEAEMAVIEETPSLRGGDENIQQILIFPDAALGNGDTAVQSSWSYIQCRVVDGDVVVLFGATPSTWPTTWPDTVTCAGGGNTLVVDLVPAVHSSSFLTSVTDMSVGATLDVEANQMVLRTFSLPASVTLPAGAGQGLLDGSAWSGLTCSIDANGDLRTLFSTSAPAGDGHCRVADGSGGTLDIPVHLTR